MLIIKSNSIKMVFVVFFLVMLISCASKSKQDEAMTITGEPKSKINLFDSEKFDVNLGHSLSSQLPEVEVTVTAPFTTNDIPERLDKWLSAVSKNGGDVNVVAMKPKTRGLFVVVDVIKLALGIYDGAKNLARLNTTSNYDAKLFYQPKDGVVTKIVFTLKDKSEK